MALLAALSAIVVVAFTWKSISQVNADQALTREGQITDRYMAAVALLGNKESEDVRLGGIYGLQRVMQDSPRDQPTVVNVISTFIRANGAKAPAGAATSVPGDIVEAAGVLRARDSRHDGRVRIDLHDVDLHGVTLHHADLRHADLRHADLSFTDLRFADLTGAQMRRADLHGAALLWADLSRAELSQADLSKASLEHANLSQANLSLAKAPGAHLDNASLRRADVSHANLSSADLSNADLTELVAMRTNLRAANLSYARLDGVQLTFADLTCAELYGADLQEATVQLDQILSAGINEDTKLPAEVADHPRVRERARSALKPLDCAPSGITVPGSN